MELNPEIKKHLEESDMALVPVALDLGSGEEFLLLAKSTGDVLREVKANDAPPKVGWFVRATDFGPVACLVIDLGDGHQVGFTAECFFDPVEEEDFRLLALAAESEALKAAFYDEGMELVWIARIPLGELERLAACQAVDRADDLARKAVEEGGELDFVAALKAYREETTLERSAEILRRTGFGAL